MGLGRHFLDILLLAEVFGLDSNLLLFRNSDRIQIEVMHSSQFQKLRHSYLPELKLFTLVDANISKLPHVFTAAVKF